ncbi:MAG: radical SAM protein [Candidatus Uhrbacteria bacterium]|nr:radical SAM protein [Candidatus Uhrbacteria bacterium]
MYVLSRFLRVREKDGLIAIFHELHPDPVYCPVAEWLTFSRDVARPSQLIQPLLDRRLLVQSTTEDDAEFTRVEERLVHKLNQPKILYLMLAQGCNFACKYCPIPALAMRYGETLLSPENARAGLRLWGEHLREAANAHAESYIIFYGGEPLLNKPTFVSALEAIRQLQASGELPSRTIRLMLTTNGTLLDDDIIRQCHEYDVIVSVGLDGFQPVSNRLRMYADGRGTFDETVSSIRRLVSSGIRTFVSASMTPENLPELASFTRFLKDIGVEKFGFNFLKGRALPEFVSELARAVYERDTAAALMRSFREVGETAYEYQLKRKIEAFHSQDFFPIDCTCYGNQLVIQPDGQISNCPFFKAELGQIGDSVGTGFRIAKTPIISEWRKRSPLFHPAFRESDAKALCGPGCAWGAHDLSGDILTPDPAPTAFSKEIFDELIWSEFPSSPK